MKHYPLPRKNLRPDAIIVANGQFPTHPVPLSLLETGAPVVCCDGALKKLLNANVMPTIVIGDCDSLSEQDRIQYASMICRITEQESNDLTKAVRYCVEQGWKDLVILGATGGREDHTIANISLLADYLDITREVWMVSDYGVMNAISEEATFESWPGQQVSIFSIEQAPMSSENLKYGFNGAVFTNWWQATLNESLNDTFTLRVSGKTIVYRTFTEAI
ncbi:thiamine diphosphokinase [Oxalobacter formigenes]|uniref:thiamine diphosphokinase n=1 Tax=Oxalobacter formigenes TaxID=847 RepID=UPI0022AFC85D|nr:thiamine diphosphokinase [Oxalobacter formigenes]WAW06098.1 thiamine diphosphokinase [Oxalobacter formigenes]